MAVVINSFFTGQCGRERKFTDDMIGGGMLEKIRAQKGCRRYEYFVPMYGGGMIMLVEKWNDRASYDAFVASELYDEVREIMARYDLTMNVELYDTGD